MKPITVVRNAGTESRRAERLQQRQPAPGAQHVRHEDRGDGGHESGPSAPGRSPGRFPGGPDRGRTTRATQWSGPRWQAYASGSLNGWAGWARLACGRRRPQTLSFYYKIGGKSMGKRELLIAVGFLVVGLVAYQLAAPPPKEGEHGFSLTRMFSEMRREIRGNPSRASVKLTGTLPVAEAITELRLAPGARHRADDHCRGPRGIGLRHAGRVLGSGRRDGDGVCQERRSSSRTTWDRHWPSASSFRPEAGRRRSSDAPRAGPAQRPARGQCASARERRARRFTSATSPAKSGSKGSPAP